MLQETCIGTKQTRDGLVMCPFGWATVPPCLIKHYSSRLCEGVFAWNLQLNCCTLRKTSKMHVGPLQSLEDLHETED